MLDALLEIVWMVLEGAWLVGRRDDSASGWSMVAVVLISVVAVVGLVTCVIAFAVSG